MFIIHLLANQIAYIMQNLWHSNHINISLAQVLRSARKVLLFKAVLDKFNTFINPQNA